MKQLKDFTERETDRIVEMAWEDRTTFDAIKVQFGISQGEVEKLMRRVLINSSFKIWRERVSSGVGVKHAFKANPDMLRFKCTRQRTISSNKIYQKVNFDTAYDQILEKIALVDPIKYADSRNFIDGSVTYLSPYISRGVPRSCEMSSRILPTNTASRPAALSTGVG